MLTTIILPNPISLVFIYVNNCGTSGYQATWGLEPATTIATLLSSIQLGSNLPPLLSKLLHFIRRGGEIGPRIAHAVLLPDAARASSRVGVVLLHITRSEREIEKVPSLASTNICASSMKNPAIENCGVANLETARHRR